MLLVNLNHTRELFGHASQTRDEAVGTLRGLPSSTGSPPSEIIALSELWGRADMSIFFLCSGYVAREELTSDYIRVSFVQLLLPCFMVDSWQAFVSMPGSIWFSDAYVFKDMEIFQWFIGSEIFHNRFWYLPGLFILRIALGIVGKMPTAHLVVACAFITVVVRNVEEGAWPVRQPFSYFPIFIAGFLMKRFNLLERYLQRVKENPSLRACGQLRWL